MHKIEISKKLFMLNEVLVSDSKVGFFRWRKTLVF
jgi:hypothetical protein